MDNGDVARLSAVWDMAGSACGVTDAVQDYPYIYFATPNPDYLDRTVCVKSCPMFYLEDGKTLTDAFTSPDTSAYYLDSDGEKVSGKPALECSINTATMDDGEVHYNVGTCDDGCFPDWDNIDFDELSVDYDWNTMTCVYNTSVLLDRLCFPTGDIVDALGEVFKEKLAEYGANVPISEILSDFNIGWPVIAGSLGISIAVGLVYMFLV